MSSIEQDLAAARVVAVLAGAMTPAQRARAAEDLRAIEGDEVAREFFRPAASALEQIDE